MAMAHILKATNNKYSGGMAAPLWLIAASLCAQTAWAEEGEGSTAPEADASARADGVIVVLGGGLPLPPATPAYGTQILDRERLNREPSGRIENALAQVAGFQQFRRSDSRSANPSAQGMTVRALGGNASSRALLLVDGVPQADPFFGYIPFTALTPERLGAVRVTRGGGVGAFGAGAVAGTVEMISADRSQLSVFDGSAFLGSRDAQEISATVSPNVGAGFVSLSGRWERGDGFYTTPATQRVAANVPARYRDWSTSLRGVAPVGAEGEIQARVALFRDNRTLRFAGANSSSAGEDASLRYISRGAWQVDALAYVQARNFTNITVSSTSYRPTLNQRDTPATGLGGKLELRPPVGGGHVLRLGADTRILSGTMLEDALNPTSGAVTTRRRAYGRQSMMGLFVEDDWSLGAVTLTAGARLDRWVIEKASFREQNAAGVTTTNTLFPDRDGWENSFRAGLIWQANDVLSLRSAAYTGFRLPTLNELYRGFTVVPVRTEANAALRPERLKGGEVGLDLAASAGTKFSATLFYNRLDNAIGNVTIGTNLRQRRNLDAIIAKGVEVSGETRIGPVELSVSYAYANGEVKATGQLNGKVPAQSPRHMVSAAMNWAPVERSDLGLRMRYVSAQYEDDLQQNRMPDALTVDGFAQWPLTPVINIVARVENLLNEKVITRQVGNDVDLGLPRTFWIGFRIRK